MEREIDKIQRAWRRYSGGVMAVRRWKRVVENESKKWRSFDDFRRRLTGAGEEVLKWDHVRKCTAHAVLRVDRSRQFLVVLSSRRSKKAYARYRPVAAST